MYVIFFCLIIFKEKKYTHTFFHKIFVKSFAMTYHEMYFYISVQNNKLYYPVKILLNILFCHIFWQHIWQVFCILKRKNRNIWFSGNIHFSRKLRHYFDRDNWEVHRHFLFGLCFSKYTPWSDINCIFISINENYSAFRYVTDVAHSAVKG